MSGLKQQIEKTFVATVDSSNGQKITFVELSKLYDDVLGLVANYKCIPRKQLEENIHNAIAKPFLEKFTFADRYYEKNELTSLLAEIKDDIEKGILELLEDSK